MKVSKKKWIRFRILLVALFFLIGLGIILARAYKLQVLEKDKLASLAQYHQILCITHLPQIASKGSTHFKVMKRVADGRTTTIISELDKKERVEELARLLGGKRISQKAIAHARELLDSGSDGK